MHLDKALKAFNAVMYDNGNGHLTLNLLTKQALTAAAKHLQFNKLDIEKDIEPLPEWAIRKSNDELEIGVQLCTKDGRRVGNGFLMAIWDSELFDYYCVLTDAGNTMRLTKDELESYYTIGQYVCDVKRIITDFDRMGTWQLRP